MLESVCQKLGIDTGDRLLRTSRKLKFLGINYNILYDFEKGNNLRKTKFHVSHQFLARLPKTHEY